MIDFDQLSKELKRDEGFVATVYTCSEGKLTVGYGHNIQDVPMPEPIAEKLLNSDIGQAIAQCEQWGWFFSLDGVRQRVIVNMVFNIGFHGVGKFKKMIDALEHGLYNVAADEMVNSRWYGQVGDRAKRLVEMMRNGYMEP